MRLMILNVGRWTRGLAIALIALVPVAVIPSSAAEAATAVGDPTGATTQWAPSWGDDFNGLAGSAPDSSKWGYDLGGQGWTSHELQDYTASTANARLDGSGHLLIDAHTGDVPSGAMCGPAASPFACTYTSARLTTRQEFQQKYGRFEIRAEVPAASSFWPAFWALGTNGQCWPAQGEIDFMEVFDDGGQHNVLHGGVHGPKTSATDCSNPVDSPSGGSDNLSINGYDPLSAGYHVYSGDWFPDHITLAVDGHTYATIYKADYAGVWQFDQPFSMLLNMAVGSPSGQVAPAASQAVMSVDYVHVFTPANPSATLTDQAFGLGSLNGQCLAAKSTPASGVAMVTASCAAGGSLQQVTFAPASLQIQGKCVDALNSGTAIGTAVQLYTCNGSGAQQWQLESNLTLVNPESGQCLSGKTATQVKLDACGAAENAYEGWSLPAVTSMTGSWPMNDGAGDSAGDTLGQHTLTCTGGTSWVPGGLDLNGSYQSCASVLDSSPAAPDPVLTTSSSYSVSAWACPDQNPPGAGQANAVDWVIAGQNGTNVSAFYLEYNHAAGTWSLNIPDKDATSATFHNAVSSVKPAAGTCVMLTGVVDGSARTATIYVNGQQPVTTTGITLWKSGGLFTLGRGLWATVNGDFFPGTIRNAHTWNFALSSAKVAALYTSEKA